MMKKDDNLTLAELLHGMIVIYHNHPENFEQELAEDPCPTRSSQSLAALQLV